MRTWTADLSILGIATRFEANDPTLLDAAVAPYAIWHTLPIDTPHRVTVRLGLRREPMPDRPARTYVSGAHLVMSARGARGTANADLATAAAIVSTEYLSDPDRLITDVVDTLVLFLLTRLGRIPFHAAGVLVDGCAALLAGPSGAGKSTLALAAHRAGLPVLSDDSVYLEVAPRPRVWGFPRGVYLLPEAAARFGITDGEVRSRAGRRKLHVPATHAWPDEPAAPRAGLFILDRGARATATPLDPPSARSAVVAAVEPGFDHFRGDLALAVAAVATVGAWRLVLSPDPAEGLAVVRETMSTALRGNQEPNAAGPGLVSQSRSSQ